MSFATNVKNEICDLRLSKTENIAELSAFVRNNGHFSNGEILLYTENMLIVGDNFIQSSKIFMMFIH